MEASLNIIRAGATPMNRASRAFRSIGAYSRSDEGVAHFVALLLVLVVFMVLSLLPIWYHVAMMRQTTLELAHHRALQLATERGYLDHHIIELIRSDLNEAGFEPIYVNGVLYPSFPNSTIVKVLRGQNVHVELKYPAPEIHQLIFALTDSMSGAKFYHLRGDDRSEALD